jgi:hypothetical protein
MKEYKMRPIRGDSIMGKRSIFLLMACVIFSLCFCGCGNKDILTLKGGGPWEANVNEVFNKQPDGNAAMWLYTENADEDTRVMFGNRELKPDFHDPKFLTMMIPKELYAAPGKYEVYLVDPANAKKSNIKYFTVH